MYKHLLVPLDGSKLAEDALPHATALARQCGATLTLPRVLPPPESYIVPEALLVDWEAIQRDREKEAQAYVASVSQRLAHDGLSVQTSVRVGDPASVIVDTAQELRADLIVMATHGRSGLARWALGSVADRVVRHASVPVMLIRPARIAED